MNTVDVARRKDGHGGRCPSGGISFRAARFVYDREDRDDHRDGSEDDLHPQPDVVAEDGEQGETAPHEDHLMPKQKDDREEHDLQAALHNDSMSHVVVPAEYRNLFFFTSIEKHKKILRTSRRI
ncbi:MAG: hypothetical protein COU33_04445 [Candidatus Magasanikbacteria bacterium CG10_big_fil_rev_8_21_14_0_10_43_6]|uniref:Uncharacterized protein n=1 Tax=Candidatus Magasanikbacteria bacterium CG10_big_fil_rev_8_21_14_0_10_43_6 TaxID=1974650 RepID=A0A2M6W0C3_9BACT|nr:MAG: hypothetical protein COU33_04445 [Candidatus Magasanikbacteria bacterium CG10_big_fil_rev_8_21_14_0_10_43_6]